MKTLFIILIAVPLTEAFLPQHSTRPAWIASTIKRSAAPTFDLDRAKECADTYGKCSVEEMEDLKQALLQERLAHELESKEEQFEHRVLEDELAIQLKMLKEEEPEPVLFPDDEEKSEEAGIKEAVAALAVTAAVLLPSIFFN